MDLFFIAEVSTNNSFEASLSAPTDVDSFRISPDIDGSPDHTSIKVYKLLVLRSDYTLRERSRGNKRSRNRRRHFPKQSTMRMRGPRVVQFRFSSFSEKCRCSQDPGDPRRQCVRSSPLSIVRIPK